MSSNHARSLQGLVVMVTRARHQAAELVAMLQARGARAVLAPAIRITPVTAAALDRAVRELSTKGFRWVLFTSRAGVDAVFERMRALDLDSSAIAAEVAAVGKGTAGALQARGIEPSVIPPTFTTHALASAMPEGSGRVLLARADIAPEGLEAVLREKGWTPVRVDAYRTELASEMSKKAAWALRKGEVDAVTFTSASTVRGFVGMGGAGAMGEALRSPRIVCIGPVTADHARAEGLPVDAVAHPHTIEGLVAALERLFAPGPRHRKETG